MINKLNFILNKKQKIYLFLLLIFWTVVYVLETVGLGTIPIILSSILESKNLIEIPILNKIFSYLSSMNSNNQDKIFSISIAIICFFVFKSLLYSLVTIYEANVNKSLNVSIRDKIIKYYLKLPYKDNLNINNSEIIRNFSLDASLASSYIFSIITLINQILLFIFILTLLAFVDYRVTFLILPVFGLIFLIFYFLTNKKLVKLGKDKQVINGELIKKINNTFDNLKEVIIYNKIAFISEKFKKNLISSQTKIAYILILKKVPKVMYELLAVLFIFFVIFFLIEKGYSRDAIIVLLSLITISIIRILPSMNLITQNISNLKSCKYSFDIIYEIHKKINLDLNKKKMSNINKINFNNFIEFKNVSFFYKDSKSKVENINFLVKKNSIVGILGPSGSGKSTMINLLTGLLTPSKGEILIDNISIQENILNWQSKISYIPQENYLLDDTIQNNIKLLSYKDTDVSSLIKKKLAQ